MSKLPDPFTASFSRRKMLKASLSAGAIMASLGTNFAHAAAGDKIRVGLIGCGGRGRGAAANAVDAAPNVELTTIGDLFEDQITATLEGWQEKPKDKYNISKDRTFVGWDAYQKVLASDVEYVILATPPGF